MKNILRCLAALFIALPALGASPASQKYLVRIPINEFRAHATQIRTMNLDVAGMNIPKGTVDLLVSADEAAQIRGAGILFPRGQMAISKETPDPQFKTPDQIAKILASYQTKYPGFAKVIVAGKSLQGRDILALEITQNVGSDISSKPAIFFNGMHHAREVMSTEVPLDIIDYLLSNYGKNAKVTHWVNSNVIYVMPMFNVDGNNIVWTKDNMWRKNARGAYGVDINRNYPFQWNTCNGSSSSKSAEDYRGPTAASEPETNVMMKFVKLIHPAFDISFHSYSELVIYPYGCGQHTETADVVEPLGAQLAAAIPSDSGSGTYTAGIAPDLLYAVDGSDIDWMYHEAHVIPYVIELNGDDQGFQPPYAQWRDKTVTKLRAAWQILLDRLDHSAIHGVVAGAHGKNITAHLKRLGASEEFSSMPVRDDGTFHMIVNPGEYTLSLRSESSDLLSTTTVQVGEDMKNISLELPR